MHIYGLNKTTLLDYPEHVAATVFTGGCNFRCPFCHNGDLVLAAGQQCLGMTSVVDQQSAESGKFAPSLSGLQLPEISGEKLWSFLRKRRGILQGVCITGGEPTLQPDLEEFIRRVKELGYLVKLDTNGYRPEVLRYLLEQNLLDYVAMDIKASRENYARCIGWTHPESFDIGRVQTSIDLLMQGQVPYEFRTTVVKGLHQIEEFAEIGQWIKGARAYYLQAYQEQEKELAHAAAFQSFSAEEMREMQKLLQRTIPVVGIRGMDL